MLCIKLLGQFQLSSLFSNQPVIGMKSRNIVKYSVEAICPMMIKGCSTGMPPIHVRIKTSATRAQNRNWVIGRNVRPCCFEV